MMAAPIKLLYIIGTLDVGGAEGQLVQLATRLDRRRFEPVVCCLTSSGPHHGALAAAGVPVEVVGFKGLRVLRHPLRVTAELSSLVRLIRRERPVIVHAFLFWAYVIGAFAARAAGSPVVIASRRSLGCFKEGAFHYLFVERLANRMTDVILANSEAVKADVIRQERVEPGKVRVIYNGVDATRYAAVADPRLRVALDIPADARTIGVIARLIDYKGHRFFLQACREVKRRHAEALFLLMGDGPDAPALAGLGRQLGLQDSVRFLGTRRDIPQLLSLLDVVALPSLEEGFPNAVLEAMAAGKPVVATRVGGVPEAVIHGETGLLVPAADAGALADAITALLDNPVRAERMGRAGRERAATTFGLDRMVLETQRMYEEILQEHALYKPEVAVPEHP
jgi:glycosyltransferase involved in cell wall biosynthesis